MMMMYNMDVNQGDEAMNGNRGMGIGRGKGGGGRGRGQGRVLIKGLAHVGVEDHEDILDDDVQMDVNQRDEAMNENRRMGIGRGRGRGRGKAGSLTVGLAHMWVAEHAEIEEESRLSDNLDDDVQMDVNQGDEKNNRDDYNDEAEEDNQDDNTHLRFLSLEQTLGY